MEQNKISLLVWIPTIVSVIALIVAIAAYNKTGQTLRASVTSEVTEETQDAVQMAEIAAARANARADLILLRTQLAAGEVQEDVGSNITAIRKNLAQAYKDTSDIAQKQWQELDMQFEQLENETREESANALDTLEGLISNLEKDVRSDEK